jgi:hypothetical protein
LQWVKQVQQQVNQQKEKAMPDIKTALENALKKTATAWAADDEPHQQMQPQQEKAMTAQAPIKEDKRIKNNVSRATFYFVRDNPGLTRDQAIARLVAQGHKAASVPTLMSQMVRARLIMEDEMGGLSAVVREYEPLSSLKKKIKPRASTEKAERKQITIVSKATGEVLNAKPVPVPVPVPVAEAVVPTMQTAESVLASMSVAEAHKLWTALNKMFGG